MWQLRPPLNPNTVLQIYVEDARPSTETEKEPSTHYLYSGAVFSTEKNVETIAKALRGVTAKFGGAQNIQLVDRLPSNGLAVIFTLEHWYSRTARRPQRAPIIVDGEFAGTVALQRDGRALATRRIEAKGDPSVLDTYIVFEREKRETQQLIVNAMEQTANSSEQKGYLELLNFFQANRQLFASSE